MLDWLLKRSRSSTQKGGRFDVSTSHLLLDALHISQISAKKIMSFYG
jgi:hypothetical protein